MPTTVESLLPEGADLRPTPEQEAAWLRYKHLGHDFAEKPLMGFGGKGRKGKGWLQKSKDFLESEKELFWTTMVPRGDNEERMAKGGHGVPLSGASSCFTSRCHAK